MANRRERVKLLEEPHRGARPLVSMREALSDPALLGNTLVGDSWLPWRVLLIAAMGERLSDDERAIFKQLTGREHEPLERVEEFVGIIGRRGGKSRAIATLACYLAGLCDHSHVLVPGETGVLLCVAPDMKQASIVLGYCEAAFERSLVLRNTLVKRIGTRDSSALELSNSITIESRSASFRRLRGPSYIAAICDESAFWFSEATSANPDAEILNAIRPGLATTAGMLIQISSPYSRRGELWESYRKHFGPGGDPRVLIAQASTRVMNSSLPQSVIDRAYERDSVAAEAEFGACFRTDLEAFVSREAVAACIDQGVRERPPTAYQRYAAFCDPSGGSGDSFSLAIGHDENEIIIIDCLSEIRPPFDPEWVVEELVAVLRNYRVKEICGDRYAGQWCSQSFEKRGVSYKPSDLPKSSLYIELLPAINSRKLRLLDHTRSIAQLCGLERRTSRGKRDSIDHPPGQHDDLANAIAGLTAVLTMNNTAYIEDLSWVGTPMTTPSELAQWRHANFWSRYL